MANTQSTASLLADRRLPGAIAANCGAVGPGAALVPHPQRSPQALSEAPSTRPAAAPCSGLNSRHGCAEPQNPAGDPKLTAAFRLIPPGLSNYPLFVRNSAGRIRAHSVSEASDG